MQLALTILVDGISYASWLFIVALGLTLVFGVLKILNIAHGSFYALGAYAAATAVAWVNGAGWPPMWSLPTMLLAALAVGLVALLTLPREEEPQISVPMVDIMVQANGLKAEDAVKLVTEPLETIVKSIDGVEHVYSQTRDDNVMVTARFLVGTSSDAAILRVHEKLRANMEIGRAHV